MDIEKLTYYKDMLFDIIDEKITEALEAFLLQYEKEIGPENFNFDISPLESHEISELEEEIAHAYIEIMLNKVEE